MFLSNYPPGSMVGSGIYSDDWDETRYCEACETDREGTGGRNDWGVRYWECGSCGASIDTVDDEYDVPEPPADWDVLPDAHLDDHDE